MLKTLHLRTMPFRVANFAMLAVFIFAMAALPAQAQEAAAQNDAAEKLVVIDVKFNGETRQISRRWLAYSLGKEFTLRMNLKLRGIDNKEALDSTKKWSEIYANGLGISIPEPPKIESMRDAWKVKNYLVDADDSVRALIAKKHSEDCAALFDIATMATLTPLLYNSGTEEKPTSKLQLEINAMLAQRFKLASMNCGFKPTTAAKAVLPLVDWIEAGKPPAPEISKPAKQVLANVKQLLNDEMSAASKSGQMEVMKVEADKPFSTSGATKAALIQTLRDLYGELKAENYEAAAKFVLMPPGVSPTELKEVIREFSEPGIARLEKEAELKTATEAFGAKRATRLANRMGADASKCFGFNHEVGDQAAEVMAQWDGTQFKLVRFDDIAKIASTDNPASSDAGKKPTMTTDAAQAAATTKKPSVSIKGFLPKTQHPIVAKLAKEQTALATAAEANPDNAEQVAKYGIALAGIGSIPNALEQLNAARKIDAKNPYVVVGIDTAIEGLRNLGVMTNGVPLETFKALMGEPDQTIDTAIGKRIVYAHWAIDMKDGRFHMLLDLRGLSEEMFEYNEFIDTRLDGRNWKTGFRLMQFPGTYSTMYLLGEQATNHSERIDVDRLQDGSSIGTIEQIAKALIDSEQASIPNSNHKILLQESDSVIIASKWPGGGNRPKDEHKLTKLVKGKQHLHRLTYTIRSEDAPDQATQMKWLKIFKEAKLDYQKK